jgi:hypothetical protein
MARWIQEMTRSVRLFFDHNAILSVCKSFKIIDQIEILEKEVEEDLIDDPTDKPVWGE